MAHRLAGTIEDGHVMYETCQPVAEYTGVRIYGRKQHDGYVTPKEQS